MKKVLVCLIFLFPLVSCSFGKNTDSSKKDQYNLDIHNDVSENISLPKDDDQIIPEGDNIQNLITYDYLIKNGCNLNFLEDIPEPFKANILALTFNDFMLIADDASGYKCMNLPSSYQRIDGLTIINDYGGEHFIDNITYDPQSGSITGVDITRLTRGDKYNKFNNTLILSREGKVYHGTLEPIQLAGSGLEEFKNFTGSMIVLFSDEESDLSALEVKNAGDSFEEWQYSDAAKAMEDCIKSDTTTSSILNNLKYTQQGYFKDLQFEYSNTFVGVPRFMLNYIGSLIDSSKNNTPISNSCFKFPGK